MLIESRPVLDPELCALVAASWRECRERPVDPVYDRASYLVAVLSGRAVGCGAWQALTAGVAELTRLYVRPAFRGRGIAGQLVVALEEEALAAGRPEIRVAPGPAAAWFGGCGYRSAGDRLVKRLLVAGPLSPR